MKSIIIKKSIFHYKKLAFAFALFSLAGVFHCGGGAMQKDDITLKRYEALGGKISILAPSSFGWMRQAMIQKKYPRSSNPPKEVLSNEHGSVNVAFSSSMSGVDFSEYEQFKQFLAQIFNAQFGNKVEWIRNEIEMIGSQKFIVLEMLTPALDSKIYNLMVFTTSKDQKENLFVSFNCIESARGRWQDIAYQIKGSIVIR